MASLKTQNAASITSQVSEAQGQIECDLKAALDKLPQALLTDAAKAVLEQRIVADLKPQLDSLQQQIDSLKHQIDALKGSAAATSTRSRMNRAQIYTLHPAASGEKHKRAHLIRLTASRSKSAQ
jgi:predicted  nucleic acid-binding Zn-ribbon protein